MNRDRFIDVGWRRCELCGTYLADGDDVLIRWTDPNGRQAIGHRACADVFDTIVPPAHNRPWWHR